MNNVLNINNPEELFNWLKNIEIEENSFTCYKLENCRYGKITLEHDKEHGYCWSLEDNYKITGSVFTYFPPC